MAENSSRLVKKRLMMQNWAALKWQSPSLAHGFISFQKSLKKAIEEMKEESIRVGEMLLMHQVKVYFCIIKRISVLKNKLLMVLSKFEIINFFSVKIN